MLNAFHLFFVLCKLILFENSKNVSNDDVSSQQGNTFFFLGKLKCEFTLCSDMFEISEHFVLVIISNFVQIENLKKAVEPKLVILVK